VASRGRIITVDSSGRIESVDPDHSRQRLRLLAWLLDSSIPIPGTRYTIGIDPLIGLFPVIGDLVGVLLSMFILNAASRLGAPRTLLLRMAFNAGIEGLFGMFPIAGDVFDAAWKANQRNVRLLEEWLDQPQRATRSSRLFAAGLICALAGFLILLGGLAFLLLRWLAGLAAGA
jgi:hypothetical protein